MLFLFVLYVHGKSAKKARFVNPVIFENICLQSDWDKQKHLMINCFYLY